LLDHFRTFQTPIIFLDVFHYVWPKSRFDGVQMKLFMKKLTWFFLFVWLVTTTYAQEYELIWEDNFNQGLNPAYWNIEHRQGVWNTGENRELQIYQRENVTVGTADGKQCLIITAKREQKKGYAFTSGRVNTKGKVTFQYGRLEANIKFSTLKGGVWPAFWTLGYTEKRWPACGEIDVMELGHRYGVEQNISNHYIGSALHYQQNGKYASQGNKATVDTDLGNGFHVYILEWTPDSIKTFIDDVKEPIFATAIGELKEYTELMHFMLLNLAIGGSYTGILKAGDIVSEFPVNMYVDYVRLYQRKGQGSVKIAPHPETGNFSVYADSVFYFNGLNYGLDSRIIFQGMKKLKETSSNAALFEKLSFETISKKLNLEFFSDIPRNMSLYTSGKIQVRIFVSKQARLKFGIQDKIGTPSWTAVKTIAENQWHLLEIPVAELNKDVNLENIRNLLMLEGKTKKGAIVSVDEILWLTN
jgi:beta-glucanase (GH16 family)